MKIKYIAIISIASIVSSSLMGFFSYPSLAKTNTNTQVLAGNPCAGTKNPCAGANPCAGLK